VALYEPFLLSHARSRGLADEDARDVVQNIFTSLLRSMTNFELDPSKGRFRTWLWRVCQNAIADWARRRGREQAAEAAWRERLLTLEGQPESEPDAEWDTACRRRILEFSVQAIRQKTDPRTWACFERHVLQARCGAEVAAELGMNVSAVYANASRVLSRIRRFCEEYTEEVRDDPER